MNPISEADLLRELLDAISELEGSKEKVKTSQTSLETERTKLQKCLDVLDAWQKQVEEAKDDVDRARDRLHDYYNTRAMEADSKRGLIANLSFPIQTPDRLDREVV